MSANKPMDPRFGTMNQTMAQRKGKGGTNASGSPFGQSKGVSGTMNHPRNASPQFGVTGQRLCSQGSGSKGSGYPPGYTSR